MKSVTFLLFLLLLFRIPGKEDSSGAPPVAPLDAPPVAPPDANLAVPCKSDRGEIRIMWYNLENLFHPDDDPIAGDDEFTPEGVRHWSYTRYAKKLTSIAKVIVASGAWEPPELVGVCEVEDARVLEALVQHPILASYGYRFLHSDSDDHRGMDVACLYREKRIRIFGWEVHAPETGTGHRRTRDMLHVSCVWGSHDSLDLFLVHLVSKYSGAGFTAGLRQRQVHQLVQRVDSVHRVRKNSLKVLAGDFNDALESYAMEPVRMGNVCGDSIRSIHLEGSLGSYKYRGNWSRIDQMLVCGPVRKYRLNGSILELPVLLTRDKKYGGRQPCRTYVGFQYTGGVSDHLPILLDISGRPFSIGVER